MTPVRATWLGTRRASHERVGGLAASASESGCIADTILAGTGHPYVARDEHFVTDSKNRAVSAVTIPRPTHVLFTLSNRSLSAKRSAFEAPVLRRSDWLRHTASVMSRTTTTAHRSGD